MLVATPRPPDSLRSPEMSDAPSGGPAGESLAEEYLERLRGGERPTIEEYADLYPELAGEIRAFFLALGLIEDFKPASGEFTGSYAGVSAAGVPPPDRLDEYRILREVGRG